MTVTILETVPEIRLEITVDINASAVGFTTDYVVARSATGTASGWETDQSGNLPVVEADEDATVLVPRLNVGVPVVDVLLADGETATQLALMQVASAQGGESVTGSAPVPGITIPTPGGNQPAAPTFGPGRPNG